MHFMHYVVWIQLYGSAIYIMIILVETKKIEESTNRISVISNNVLVPRHDCNRRSWRNSRCNRRSESQRSGHLLVENCCRLWKKKEQGIILPRNKTWKYAFLRISLFFLWIRLTSLFAVFLYITFNPCSKVF